ncbi:MAG: PAS domain-containing sensor histidine kinase [Candidatus Neomarinimicrobiota bacterium]|nr:MAG: PAS domain-containing sensor histidine kinase [Candidatus Neomarinimicrobiota bacterium]
MFNNSPQGIVILNKQDEILNINKGFEDLFQYTREELVGKKLAYHIVPDRLKEESTRYSERVFKDEVVRTETVRKRKDGSEIHVSILAFPIQFGDEDPAIYAIYSDITDRVRYQEDLQASEARFRTLANELSAMNDMKETLLDVISHDLRNPAGVIFSMTDLMVQEDPDSEALQLLKTSSEDLLSVIENATSLSRVAFGEDIQKESLDLAQLIPRIVQDFGPELKRNGLEVDVDLPDSLEIQANRLVSEIFKNYLSNAIKYAAHGKRIQIVGVREPHSVTVEVRDFGTTIPGDQLQSIFTRGVRLEGGKKKGRGLGLAIVKRIAEVHNGEVGVRPNSPKGNIFYVTLPVK